MIVSRSRKSLDAAEEAQLAVYNLFMQVNTLCSANKKHALSSFTICVRDGQIECDWLFTNQDGGHKVEKWSDLSFIPSHDKTKEQ